MPARKEVAEGEKIPEEEIIKGMKRTPRERQISKCFEILDCSAKIRGARMLAEGSLESKDERAEVQSTTEMSRYRSAEEVKLRRTTSPG
jgi:hypothetical protein